MDEKLETPLLDAMVARRRSGAHEIGLAAIDAALSRDGKGLKYPPQRIGIVQIFQMLIIVSFVLCMVIGIANCGGSPHSSLSPAEEARQDNERHQRILDERERREDAARMQD